jgi:hypothetical protein
MSASKVLIHAYSFEERSVAVVERLLQQHRFDVVCSIDYMDVAPNLEPLYRSNRSRCETVIAASGVKHAPISARTVSQFQMPRKLDEVLGRSSVEVTLDISCLTKLHVLRLLYVLYGRIRYVTYIGAESHWRDPDILQSGVAARIGHKECVGVVGYDGLHRTSAPQIAVLLLGLEGDRALSSYLELDPGMAIGVVGVPWVQPQRAVSYIDEALHANAPLLAHHNVFTELAPSLAPTDFASRLDDIVQEYQARAIERWSVVPNITVIPLCTKIQTLGLYFYWTKHPELRIVYPVPQSYQQTARGAGRMIVTELREYRASEPLTETVRKRLVARARSQRARVAPAARLLRREHV